MNTCIIKSNNSFKREYKVKTTSAMKCAKELGRGEFGEIITVKAPKGRTLSRVVWIPEDGGKYVRTTCCVIELKR